MKTQIEQIIQQADNLIKQKKYRDAWKLLFPYKENPLVRQRLKSLKAIQEQLMLNKERGQLPATKQKVGWNKHLLPYGIIFLVLFAFICSILIFISTMPNHDTLPTEAVIALVPTELSEQPTTEIPTETPSSTATSTETPSPTDTASPTETDTATPTATNTSTRTPLPTATNIPPTFTPIATATTFPTAIPNGTIYYASEGDVHVRECQFADNERCPVVGVLAKGQEIVVIATVTGSVYRGGTTWYQVNFNGQIAYVHALLVSLSRPIPQQSSVSVSSSNQVPSSNYSCSTTGSCTTSYIATATQSYSNNSNSNTNNNNTNTSTEGGELGGDIDFDGLPDSWEANAFGCVFGANPSWVLRPNGNVVDPGSYTIVQTTAVFPNACRNYNPNNGTYDIYLGQNSTNDPDKDGCNNGCEYVKGTNPWDSYS